MPIPRGPFIPIPLTAKVELIGHQVDDNRPVVMVLHARVGASPTVTQLGNIGLVFSNEFSEQAGSFPTDYSFDLVRVTDLNTATGPQTVVAGGGLGTGGPGLPNMCTVTEFFTAQRGRSFTGRVHAPVPTANVNSGTGDLVATVAAGMNTFWGDINTELAALSPASGLVVASRKLASSSGVTSISTRASAGFIHRRKFG